MLTFSGTRADLARYLRAIPTALSGGPDPLGIARGIQLRVGVAVLSCVQQAFVVKSRGGAGDDGIKWAPLARATVAQRRTSAADRRSLGITGKRVRGLLTPAEDRRWRAIFGSRLAQLRQVMGEGEAKARAAQIAWGVLKSEGAKTKLEVLGGRTVDILRDTSKLFRSLTPGVADRPSGADGQVFRTPPGHVIVGTNVPYAAAQHAGRAGRIPARPLWPLDGRLPKPWADAAARAIKTGVVRAVALLVERGRVA